MAPPTRREIRIGMTVRIVEKQNQRTGALTEGIVARILTSSASHPHGIKVMLEDGRVGRVKSVVAVEGTAPSGAAPEELEALRDEIDQAWDTHKSAIRITREGRR